MYRWWFCVCFFLPRLLCAQPEYSLSGLLNFGPQANFLHPAYLPDGSFFLGLPVLSKVSVLGNNRFSYTDIENAKDPTDLLRLDRNSTGLELGIGLFLCGVKFKPNHYVSLFMNHRTSTFLYYPKDAVRPFSPPDPPVSRQKYRIDELWMDVSSYQEIGLGYSFPVTKKLRGGVHLKYLNGLADLYMSGGVAFDLDIDNIEERHELLFRRWSMQWSVPYVDVPTSLDSTTFVKDWGLRPERAKGRDFLFSSNRGMALDMGVSYEIAPLLNLSVTLRDIGMISWKENPQSHSVFSKEIGIDSLLYVQDKKKPFRDQLVDSFVLESNADRYLRWLYYSMISTLSWRLSRDNYFSTSLMLQRLPGSFPGRIRGYYSLSYLRHLGRHVSASASVMRYPQHFTLGLGLVYNVGPLQVYASVGNLKELIDAAGIRIVDVNFGINIITGRSFAKYDKNARLCP